MRGSIRHATRQDDHGDRRRRVMVKMRYHIRTKSNYIDRIRAHVSYLQRDRAGEDGRPAAFFDQNRDGLDGRTFVESIQFDRRHFRLILAPNDGERIADMKTYVRDVMRWAENDLATRLEWVAVIHEKADASHAENRHAHVILRGVDENRQALRIAPVYIKTGFRERAQEEATMRLGPMSDRKLEAWRQHVRDRAQAREAGQGERSR